MNERDWNLLIALEPVSRGGSRKGELFYMGERKRNLIVMRMRRECKVGLKYGKNANYNENMLRMKREGEGRRKGRGMGDVASIFKILL